MSNMYALRRANGDWFAFDDRGRFRVPVFRTSGAAMQSRARNFGMLLFRPVVLDERSLNDIAPTNGKGDVYFYLIDNPDANSNHGRQVEHTQLALLMRDSTQQS